MSLMRGVAWLVAAAWVLPLQAAETTARAVAAAPVEPVGMGGLAQVLLALILVLALIVGMAWLMRRMGGIGQGGSGAIRLLGGIPVGQRERVVLVQVGETQLLLGVAPGRVQTLHVLDRPVSVAPAPGTGGDSFAERLTSALKKGGRP